MLKRKPLLLLTLLVALASCSEDSDTTIDMVKIHVTDDGIYDPDYADPKKWVLISKPDGSIITYQELENSNTFIYHGPREKINVTIYEKSFTTDLGNLIDEHELNTYIIDAPVEFTIDYKIEPFTPMMFTITVSGVTNSSYLELAEPNRRLSLITSTDHVGGAIIATVYPASNAESFLVSVVDEGVRRYKVVNNVTASENIQLNIDDFKTSLGTNLQVPPDADINASISGALTTTNFLNNTFTYCDYSGNGNTSIDLPDAGGLFPCYLTTVSIYQDLGYDLTTQTKGAIPSSIDFIDASFTPGSNSFPVISGTASGSADNVSLYFHKLTGDWGAPFNG